MSGRCNGACPEECGQNLPDMHRCMSETGASCEKHSSSDAPVHVRKNVSNNLPEIIFLARTSASCKQHASSTGAVVPRVMSGKMPERYFLHAVVYVAPLRRRKACYWLVPVRARRGCQDNGGGHLGAGGWSTPSLVPARNIFSLRQLGPAPGCKEVLPDASMPPNAAA